MIPDDGDKSSPGGAINTIGVQQFAHVYAGVRNTPDPDGTLIVLVAEGADVTALATCLDALVSSGQIAAEYRFEGVRRSYAVLQKYTIAIAGDREIGAHGIKLASVTIDAGRNKVLLRLLREYSTEAAEYLVDRYGSDLIIVDEKPQESLPTFVQENVPASRAFRGRPIRRRFGSGNPQQW